ncbi:MAG: hypothetical protein A2Y12_13060 [Planctomycetes bacterium GWF2_42_9]|nr:MAG: hypothetical protein A2Y12_13060 [Planctomycetes bacterium GWF2_42_9]
MWKDKLCHKNFAYRSYYVNFSSHLLNTWNANLLFPNSPNIWPSQDFSRLLDMVKAFGFTCFEYWLVPDLFEPEALENKGKFRAFASTMQDVTNLAHKKGLQVKYALAPNCIGHDWYFACPGISKDKELILKLWRHWAKLLNQTDIVGIFPGDPGGCNRNGCDHNTFIDLTLELTDITLQENPRAIIDIGTWGTPFSGWGNDMCDVQDWDGSWEGLTNGVKEINVAGCHIWNGTPDRAKVAMSDFIKRLPEFPKNAVVGINLGFSPDADATVGGDAREYVREIARLRRISSWDYSVCEGELVVYPHWRLPRIFSRRREELAAAPYYGTMSYTMSPKLSHLCMYAAGQAAINPDRDPDEVSSEFFGLVFGDEHKQLGELFEAFEVVKGWGYYPRRNWSNQQAHNAYLKIIEHLEAADTTSCKLPLFPSPEQYRKDLLWFARIFSELSGQNPDRDRIEKQYWNKTLEIYDHIPMSADQRAHESAQRFANIFANSSECASWL